MGSQDTFYVGTLKGMSHAYQQTFVDIYAKAAFAKLYLAVNDFEHTETKAQSPL